MFATGDPLFQRSFDGWVLAIVVAKTLIVFGLVLVAVMFMVWFERKVIADMQNRIGPNRAGPWGMLQTLADGTKLFFKEDIIPENADRTVFRLAPYLAVVPAFLTFAVIPFGGTVTLKGSPSDRAGWYATNLQLVDPPIGLLLVLALSSIAVYGVMLAGWSSGSKYPLLGSVRASAQMVSYEAALGLSVLCVVLVTGSIRMSEIVGAQVGDALDWNIVQTGVVPFLLFLVAATAELNRPPFDLVEAEQELVGGFNTEYSGMRFAMFFLAEFMNTVTMSAVIVTLFLGGPTPPMDKPSWIGFSFPEQLHVVWPVLWFVAKVFIFLFTYVWLRATLPRFRYDQLMDLGWKRMIPIGLAWVLLIAAVQAGNGEMADVLRNLAIVITAVVLSAFVLIRAMRLGTSRYQEVGAPGDEHVAADGVLTEEHN
jgi:NADH-quinone oxidoreductase subunit H